MQKPKIERSKDFSCTDTYSLKNVVRISWYSLFIFVTWYRLINENKKKYFGFSFGVEI